MTRNDSDAPRDTAGEILADMLAVASGSTSGDSADSPGVRAGAPANGVTADAVVDETVVVSQPVPEVSDHTVVVNQPVSERVAEDHTIVVAQPAPEASDHTVVVAQPAPEVSDHTVVVNHAGSEHLVDDRTVVVNQPHADAPATHVGAETVDDLVGDGTVVVAAPAETAPRSRRDRRERGSRRGTPEQASADSNPAPPVDAPQEKRSLRRIIGGGLDPQRPIAEAPGSLPWEMQPTGERGVSQGLPVSYGARVQTEMPLELGIDEVQRRVGPAPDASHVEVVQGRHLLPSLQRRDRKRNLVTLLLYTGLTVACVFGLWGVATIAFGW